MYNIRKLLVHRQQLTVQYYQVPQTAVDCKLSATYRNSS